MTALDMGAVEELILYENLSLNRYVLRNPATNEEVGLVRSRALSPLSSVFRSVNCSRNCSSLFCVSCVRIHDVRLGCAMLRVVQKVQIFGEREEKKQENFQDAVNHVDLEVKDKTALVEWLATNYNKYGANLNFVTNKSTEGSQFCKGTTRVGTVAAQGSRDGVTGGGACGFVCGPVWVVGGRRRGQEDHPVYGACSHVLGFGGIGGILRYRVDFNSLDDIEDDDEGGI